MTRAGSGVRAIAIATILAGGLGYVLTWIVFRSLGPADYALFALFWAAFYFVLVWLWGLQQEVARATRPPSPALPARSLSRFTLGITLVVLVLLALLLPLWLVVFSDHEEVILPLAVGATGYVLTAVAAGRLYGAQRWRMVAVLVTVDGLLRFAGVVAALAFSPTVPTLAWAVAAAFPLSLLVLAPAIAARVRSRYAVDVGDAALAWNSLRAVAAAVFMGVLISGFPLLLGVADGGRDRAALGTLILVVMIVRSPLVIPAMSFQAFLIVQFRSAARPLRLLLVVVGGVFGAGILLSIAGAAAGPYLFELLFAADVGVLLVVAAVLSSVLLAVLFVTGTALLAGGAHGGYLAGWAAAVVATIATLLLPLDLELRGSLAMVAGPAVGLVVHAFVLARTVGRVSV